MESERLVSIGVPTYNRASMLERALKTLVAQDYPHLEIIISDNASTDNTHEICKQLQQQYSFVQYHRNPVGIPALKNFKQTLLLSSGYYFMWAADDDLWEPTFVSTLLKQLENDPRIVLVAAEAQYILADETRLPFFPEGAFYYNRPPSPSALRRMLQVVRHNYGNLIYGVYQRQALFTENGTVLDACDYINEIPVFLQVAMHGGIQACSQVLFYKTTNLFTYAEAAREYNFTPELGSLDSADGSTAMSKRTINSRFNNPFVRKIHVSVWTGINYLREAWATFLYHVFTMQDILRVIVHLKISLAAKLLLSVAFALRLAGHYVKAMLVWKLQNLFESKPTPSL